MKQIILAAVALFAASCEKQSYEVEPTVDLALFVLPQDNTIEQGETIDIQCELHASYFYSDNATFTLQWEQVAGSGELRMEGEELKQNTPYTLPKGEFIMSYTAQGEEHHTIRLTTTDQFSNTETRTIQFTNI